MADRRLRRQPWCHRTVTKAIRISRKARQIARSELQLRRRARSSTVQDAKAVKAAEGLGLLTRILFEAGNSRAKWIALAGR